MKRQTTILVVVAALLAACATRATAPDWISGTAARYPAAEYLLGRGEGARGEAARERARADLAKTLGVVVLVESEDLQAYRAGEEGGYAGESRRHITTRAEQLIEGLVIAETWRDPASGRHHALAVLPRLAAAARLRAAIERLDETTRVAVAAARAAGDTLEQIGAAHQAVAAQDERAGLQRQLRVIDPAGVGEPPSWSRARLAADLEALVQRVRLAPRTAPAAADGFEAVLPGGIAAAGFTVATGNAADYVLEGDLTLEDLGRRDGWYWQRGVLALQLREPASGRVRGTRRWPIKSSALTAETARARALDAAEQLLRRELRATLIGFAGGQGAGGQ